MTIPTFNYAQLLATLNEWVLFRYGSQILWYGFGFPLKLLYFNGPTVMGIGFWEGRTGEDICAQLTNIDSSFWLNNREVCIDFIERKFGSYFMSVIIVMYFVFLYRLVTKVL